MKYANGPLKIDLAVMPGIDGHFDTKVCLLYTSIGGHHHDCSSSVIQAGGVARCYGAALQDVYKRQFKNISAKAVIKVPKEKKSVYSKLLNNKGQKKTVKIK